SKHDLTGCIVSITLLMAAIFLPITFIKGTKGVFYQQYGITLIVAIGISAINALTLSPALCTLLLKPHKEEEKGKKKNFMKRFFFHFNRIFDAMTTRYTRSFKFLIAHKWVTFAILGVCGVLIYFAN